MISYGDRVLQTSITSGTGSLSLIAAPTGWRSFVAAVGNGKKVSYHIDDGTNWESGIGTITSGTPDTLSRDKVLESSNSDAPVNFGSNTKNVRLALLSMTFPSRDENLNFTEGFTTATGTNTHALTLDPEPADYSDGMEVSYFAPNANSAAVNINVNALGNKELTINGTSLTSGQISSGQLIKATYKASTGKFQWNNPPVVQTILRNHIEGFIQSTAGGSTTLTVGAGQAADSSNGEYISLASSLAKTTGAWAVGNAQGGLDTGTISNNAWYAVFAIKRPDTGVVDMCLSAAANSAPQVDGSNNVPAAYTKYRRVGFARTNGSGQWVRFVQTGDNFDWYDTVQDVSANNPGTAAVSRALTVPPLAGIIARIQAHIADSTSAGGANNGLIVSPLDVADEAPTVLASGNYNSDVTLIATSGTTYGVLSTRKDVRVNGNREIRTRIAVSDANKTLYIRTLGWVDKRGKE